MELLNFYSFFPITDPASLAQDWRALGEKLDLKGSLLFAPEGVNVSLNGEACALDIFLKEKLASRITIDPALLRRTKTKGSVYSKLKVKLKTEIIHSNFGIGAIERERNRNTYIEPEKFHAMAKRKNVCLVDMRNDYEFMIGTFRGALCLPLKEFCQLPRLFEYLEAYREQDILIFCTGGVRCEKALPLLRKKGFRAFQLYGGILRYLEKYGKQKDRLWQGECFVFDERVALNAELEKGSYEWCGTCGQPSQSGVCVLCER